MRRPFLFSDPDNISNILQEYKIFKSITLQINFEPFFIKMTKGVWFYFKLRLVCNDKFEQPSKVLQPLLIAVNMTSCGKFQIQDFPERFPEITDFLQQFLSYENLIRSVSCTVDQN